MPEHKKFGVEFNNKVFELLEQPLDTPEARIMLSATAQASLLHWSKFEDCKKVNLARGYYMVARSATFAGFRDVALLAAQKSYDITREFPGELADFDFAYAHEALARAYALNGKMDEAQQHYSLAKEQGENLKNEGDKKIYMGDLAMEPWYGLV